MLPFRQMDITFINATNPMIAAVNGLAAEWGVMSIALFDLVYSVPDAYFFTPFVYGAWQQSLAQVSSSCVSYDAKRQLP
jgi:enoyl-CoA hydratase/carnithine racemase